MARTVRSPRDPGRPVRRRGAAPRGAGGGRGELVARIAGLLVGRTVTWSKVKSHTTLTTTAHLLNREADLRAGAVVEALAAGRPWEAGPGWTG